MYLKAYLLRFILKQRRSTVSNLEIDLSTTALAVAPALD